MTNDSGRSLAYPEVVVELLDGRGNVTYRVAAPVAPARLAPGEEGSYLVPLPEGADLREIRVSAGPLPVRDDDPIDVTLRQLLRAIQDYRSEHEHGNGYVFDISELYAALSAEFGGEDRDRDGVEDVEQVFRSHGFFADLDGSRSWRAGEAPGLTSHPAFQGFPAALPRPDLPAPPEATVTIDSGGVATHAVVYLTFAPPNASRSYGYVTAIVDGQIVLAPPPPGYDAELTILLLADGYTPALVARFDNAELWSYWEQAPGQSVIEISATLHPADGSSDDDDLLLLTAAAPGAGPAWPLPPIWAWIIFAEVAVVVLASGAISIAHFRGRGR